MNVTVTRAANHGAEGFAEWNGERYEWTSYRETPTKIRVMLCKPGEYWLPRQSRHPARAAILPIATNAMNNAKEKNHA